MSSELEKFRDDIDLIDKQIVALISERMQKAYRIAEYKKQNSLPVFDESREKALLEKINSYAEEELKPYMNDIYMEILKTSKKYQQGIIDG